ncbi:family 14 glycosylhydrolase [Paenibacillus kobensis]|uniref:family 14 glycosylhydrolase n=1 Tax=Paenibacillus kobensis TaxID=59841 RepID=UPI000FD8822B|nr:family 14 glycosylhydrolase [Paenibacillus kobensis]
MSLGKRLLKKGSSLLLSLTLLMSVVLGLSTGTTNAAVGTDFRVSVMGPLTQVTDWTSFRNQLQTLKSNGVYAITTDVWWGIVESAGDNQFDWSYYKTYADAVRAAGLKWVPIMSTHQCGGNVGDNCNFPLPSWLWSKGTADEMQFKDEAGFVNKEAISPFWSGISAQYNELYASFAQNFASYKDIIAKIYLSGGPAGELRFPSYNAAAGWSYPSRGKFEVYTDTAKQAFRSAMISKYGSLSGVNSAWGLSLTSQSQINPPSDGDAFYTGGGYATNYGKDFLTWYQSVLQKHLGVIATAAHNQFDSVFGVRIGSKISGVHWQMSSPTMPHSAEQAAGYYDYNSLIQTFKDNNLDLTFTCLEMFDAGSAPNYSMPSTLVNNVSSIANAKGVRINGENALVASGSSAFQKIEEKITTYNYSGFTLLRLNNIVNSDGSATSDMALFKQYVISHSAQDDTHNSVTVYYKKGYATPFIHYRPAGGTWTAAPGVRMQDSEVSGYAKITIDIGSATQLEACFNDGNGNWDSNNSKNYFFNVGTSTYMGGGVITSGPPAGITPDTTAPSVPTGLTSTGKTDTTVSLSWTASTDNTGGSGLAGYDVYRNGNLVKSGVTAASYTDTGLSPATSYSYTVRAKDIAGNVSAGSSAISVTTNTAPATNKVTVYYKKGFTTPFIHYRPAGGTWTAVPGVRMQDSEVSGYAKITIDIGTATQLEACFNDGNGNWDSNNARNYFFNAGTWTYSGGGVITAGAPVVSSLAA